MKYSKYDAIIIGSGLAGLFLANKLASEENYNDGVAIITKDKLYSGSTALAQGGIVSVIPELNFNDSVESHIKDTLRAGCGLNDINSVKFVSENSAFAIQELMAMGVKFDSNDNGMLNFTLEGAHSCPRILHCKGDSTGSVIEEVLCKNAINNQNLYIYENTMALELLLDSTNAARGIITFNHENNIYEAIYSNNIIIATGGIGQLYLNTTNPETSTADGIAMAIRAGCKVENMEFVQFHPTGLCCKNNAVTPLVSESVRGEGARLVNINGEYFAKKYHKDGELAPRDIVARAIVQEMQNTSSDHVNLDISGIGIAAFSKRFPSITKLCKDNNIDISSGLIPVSPVQHYFMGGIKTNINSETTVKNVYAIGECSMTGLHGANRLASNSLLECAVFAQNLCDNIIKRHLNPPKILDDKIQNAINKYSEINSCSDDIELINDLFIKLKRIMTEYVSISRNKDGLNKALSEIENIQTMLSYDLNTFHRRKYELLNAITVSKEIINSAMRRVESIGAHFRTDSDINYSAENTKKIGNDDYEKLLAR